MSVSGRDRTFPTWLPDGRRWYYRDCLGEGHSLQFWLDDPRDFRLQALLGFREKAWHWHKTKECRVRYLRVVSSKVEFFGPDDSATNESGYDHSSPEEQIVFSAEEDAASSVGTDSFHSGTSNDSERGVGTEIRSVSFGPSFESDGFHSDGSHDTLVKLKKEIARSPSKTLIGADGGRISNTLCLETGKLGQTRGHRALVRSDKRMASTFKLRFHFLTDVHSFHFR